MLERGPLPPRLDLQVRFLRSPRLWKCSRRFDCSRFLYSSDLNRVCCPTHQLGGQLAESFVKSGGCARRISYLCTDRRAKYARIHNPAFVSQNLGRKLDVCHRVGGDRELETANVQQRSVLLTAGRRRGGN